MGNFDGQRWRPYLDKEAQEIRDEKIDHLKRNYNGPSDFIKQKLKEEDALTIEQKIQKIKSEIDEKKDDLEKFRQIQRQREMQDKLRDKKELLKEKQKKLRKVQRSGYGSEVDAWYVAASRAWKRCVKSAEHPKTDHESPVEAFEAKNMAGKVQAWKNRHLDKQVDVDELVEDVERLQDEVAELNGGSEDWFLDVQSVEVTQ